MPLEPGDTLCSSHFAGDGGPVNGGLRARKK
jgi:hypothetical protein